MGRPLKLDSEDSIRKKLDEIENEICTYHSGNAEALAKGQSDARKYVLDGVNRRVIDPRTAETFKRRIDNFSY